MAVFETRTRRLMVAAGFAIAIAAAPAAALATTPASSPLAPLACPAGETEDLYTDNCIPEMSPNVPGGNFPTVQPDMSLPEVDGIPCTGHNSGECIGLQEEQGNVPDVSPHSSLSSSP
jgi:hypothetical protein